MSRLTASLKPVSPAVQVSGTASCSDDKATCGAKLQVELASAEPDHWSVWSQYLSSLSFKMLHDVFPPNCYATSTLTRKLKFDAKRNLTREQSNCGSRDICDSFTWNMWRMLSEALVRITHSIGKSCVCFQVTVWLPHSSHTCSLLNFWGALPYAGTAHPLVTRGAKLDGAPILIPSLPITLAIQQEAAEVEAWTRHQLQDSPRAPVTASQTRATSGLPSLQLQKTTLSGQQVWPTII